MHVVIFFAHIGNYHIARLQAAYQVCQEQGWNFTALQVTDRTSEHPWGELERNILFPIETLLPAASTPPHVDRRPDSPAAAALIAEALDQLRPNVLAIPGWGFPVCRAALRWSRRHQIPAILMSESKWDDEQRIWWKEQLKSWLYVRRYDAALVGGTLHQAYLVRLGFPIDRIFFGYDVVDNDYFAHHAAIAQRDPDAARSRQPALPNQPYFLAATRFIPRKNILRLITAYAEYRQTIGCDRAWNLVVCGSGSEENTIRQMIQALEIEAYVHLPGFIKYQQIGDWYGLAKALIHPALQEQWGLVINEACAAGLPILCSQTVGACELVQVGINGFTFDPNSTVEIAQTLIAFYQLDADSQYRFGQASRAIIANYAPATFGDSLRSAIKTVLERVIL